MAVPALAELLTDREKRIREIAAVALGKIGPEEIVLGHA